MAQVPVVFTILALVVMRTMPQSTDAPPLSLNMRKYGPNSVVFNATYSDVQARGYSHFYKTQVRGYSHFYQGQVRGFGTFYQAQVRGFGRFHQDQVSFACIARFYIHV